jgi:hypothetical protein
MEVFTVFSLSLWKESLDNDDHQFHQYQQSEQSSLILTKLTEHKKTTTYDVVIETCSLFFYTL